MTYSSDPSQKTSSVVDTPKSRRKYRIPRWGRLSITLTVLFSIILIVAVVTSIGSLTKNMHTTPVEGLSAESGSKEPMNILVVGSDERDGAIEAGDAEGRRSDSMVLVHINGDSTEVTGVQIPRDTMVPAPSCAAYDDAGYTGDVQVNSLLNDGESCLVSAVSSMTGLPIHHFVDMNFHGFMSMVDALDGIDICLPEALKDPDANLDLPAGCQKVRGEDALALARTRHAVGDGSDLARMEHQQDVISAILHKAEESSILSHPKKFYSFASSLTSSVTVDDGLKSTSSMTSLARRFKGVSEDDFTVQQLPTEPYLYDYNRVQLSDEGKQMLDKLGSAESLR